jgi:hypothetical protein
LPKKRFQWQPFDLIQASYAPVAKRKKRKKAMIQAFFDQEGQRQAATGLQVLRPMKPLTR